ncbi:MAG: hypothetical protein MUF64_05170 [Polyangiaceae bacterium]|jgi:hypothetical protein|nr:hypothetical protein [Polyangiaceae bacterium]
MSRADLPDPIQFTQRALEALGALSDLDDRGPYLLLPEDQAQRLQSPTELRPSERPDVPGTVFCGLGSALLDQLCQDLRGGPFQATFRLDLPPPRPAQATSLAQRIVFRNAIHEVLDAGPLVASYGTMVSSYVAEADDRYEGLVSATACLTDGGLPDASVRRWLDPGLWPEDLTPESLAPGAIADAISWLWPRIEQQVEQQCLPPLLEALGRRKLRDHERIAAYFAELIEEARAPRRKADEGAIRSKVEHLLAERDAKLRELDPRYTLRVRVHPVATVVVILPSVSVRLLVRRRKESRELRVRLPAQASALDAFCCEGCGSSAPQPAVCDLKLHLLCDRCVPAPQGRFDCPACHRPKRALESPLYARSEGPRRPEVQVAIDATLGLRSPRGHEARFHLRPAHVHCPARRPRVRIR